MPRLGGFTGVRLMVALAALLSLAFVPPAWLAVRVNRTRMARAEEDVRSIAETFQRADRAAHDAAAPDSAAAAVRAAAGAGTQLLAGPGEAPRVDPDAGDGWESARVSPLTALLGADGPHEATVRLTADPWGNRYAVNVGAAMSSGSATAGAAGIWVVSSGPNGIIETPFIQRSGAPRLGGDDIGAPLLGRQP